MNLANKLTIFRIILVPIMVLVPFLNLSGEYLGISFTFWLINLIFVIAAITDKLDGYIARKRNEITAFGKFLDPIADKILVLAALIMLVEFLKLPAWIPIIVAVREFIVSGYRLIEIESAGRVVAASIWGKIKTVTQMFAIILAFLDVNYYLAFMKVELTGFQLYINILATTLMFVSVIATVFSGWDYVKNGKELLFGKGNAND